MQEIFHPLTLISVELFIIQGDLSSSETRFSLSLSCYSMLCQYQTRWKHKTHKRGSWHWLFQPHSAFCLAKLSAGGKLAHKCFPVSPSVGPISMCGSTDAPSLPHLALSCFSKEYCHQGSAHRAHPPLPEEVTSCFHCLRWAQTCSGVTHSWEKWSSLESHWGKRSRRNDSALNLNSDTNE